MLAAVQGLGFKPHLAAEAEQGPGADDTPDADRAGDAAIAEARRHPEPVAAALRQARTERLLVLIDFFADWCVPCRVLEKDVFPDPRLRELLEGYLLVRVDVDHLPDVANNYEVAAMPTLVVLDSHGQERQRLVGIMTVERLLRDLPQLSRQGADGP